MDKNRDIMALMNEHADKKTAPYAPLNKAKAEIDNMAVNIATSSKNLQRRKLLQIVPMMLIIVVVLVVMPVTFSLFGVGHSMKDGVLNDNDSIMPPQNPDESPELPKPPIDQPDKPLPDSDNAILPSGIALSELKKSVYSGKYWQGKLDLEIYEKVSESRYGYENMLANIYEKSIIINIRGADTSITIYAVSIKHSIDMEDIEVQRHDEQLNGKYRSVGHGSDGEYKYYVDIVSGISGAAQAASKILRVDWIFE